MWRPAPSWQPNITSTASYASSPTRLPDDRKVTATPDLHGTQTHENLIEAFRGESQANRRYLYFARKADVEGKADIAALFRSVSQGETGHAFGHFDFLAEVGDPATGVAVGATNDNLKSAIEGETYEYTEMYPPATKASRKSPSGSRPSPAPNAATPVASPKDSDPSAAKGQPGDLLSAPLGKRCAGEAGIAHAGVFRPFLPGLW
jgi:rubrerythrin